MQELCSRRNTLELRGLAQEENVTPNNSAKSGTKSSQGKMRKKERESENDSEDEEDYLKPADSSFRRKVHKAPKGSKKKKTFREVFSLVEDDQHKSVNKNVKGMFNGKSAVKGGGNLCNHNYEGQERYPNVFQETRRTFPEEVTIMSSAGEFSSFNLFVSR